VSNLWTRVPEGQPPLDRLQLRLLPLVDLVMGLMWSRPGGLSLRTTWVTPATIALGTAVALVVGVGGILAAVYSAAGGNALALVVGVAGWGLGLGSGAVAFYGIRQRWIS
jgi:hypothetical protein